MIIENTPLVSVVIACYNHEQFVQDCIYSVINQTYRNIELIIIDDGSKDNSIAKIQEMVELCEQRFIRFEFRYRPNKGLAATLNEALIWCKGEYYCPFASDDIMLENKLKIQVDFLEKNNNCVAVCGGISIVNQDNKLIKNLVLKKNTYTFNQIFMLKHNLPAPTQMSRLDIVKKVGGYNTNIKLEDWYMWLLLSTEGELCYIPELLSKYRYHENNTFKQIDTMYSGRIQILNLYKKHVLYSEAQLRVEWLKACELCFQSKNEALKNMFGIIRKYPNTLISYDFLRFLYWLMVKSRSNK